MFLRAHVRRGLDAAEAPVFAGARDAGGAIVAVAAHCPNGVLLVQGLAAAIGDVARAAVARTGRDVSGFSGPHACVAAARAALDLGTRRARLDTCDDLFALALADLRVPPALGDGSLTFRRAAPDDAETIAHWGEAYAVETLGAAPTPVTADRITRTREYLATSVGHFLLLAGDTPAATMRFTATLPDCVQIGGVYTPPSLRGRGHARAVVAGALLEARAVGASRSILFTERSNAPARAAYLSLGYTIVGDYGLVFFD